MTKTFRVRLLSNETEKFRYGFVKKYVEANGVDERDAMFNAERDNHGFQATSATEGVLPNMERQLPPTGKLLSEMTSDEFAAWQIQMATLIDGDPK